MAVNESLSIYMTVTETLTSLVTPTGYPMLGATVIANRTKTSNVAKRF